MKKRNVSINAGGGGSPEQSQRVVFVSQLGENYSQSSARQAVPEAHPREVGRFNRTVIRPAMPARFRLQARALAFNAKGGEPAEAAERHPQSDPSGNLTKEVLVPDDWTTRKVSVEDAKCLSLRADECRRGNPVKSTALHVIPNLFRNLSHVTNRNPTLARC